VDGEPAETTEPSEPSEPGEKLGSGGGEPLGGGTSTELSAVLVSLGASEIADDGGCEPIGLVEAVDGADVGENDGTPTLDGPSVDDNGGADPELGWPDCGDVWLLPGIDVGESLGADGPALLGGVDGCELAVGLVESPGLPDAGEPDFVESDVVAESDVAEPDVGLVLDGGSTLPDIGDVEGGPLLGPADDGADWLGTLDNTALGSDDAAGLADSCEPEVGLVLDGGSMLPDAGDVELGGASLDTGEVPLLGATDEGADWLGALDSSGLASDDTPGLVEPPELADRGDVDC
jgi:hypothetical protein